jgi:hypothetical protein
MSWILVLSLLSAPNGNYVREFKTEKQCTQEMNRIIKNMEAQKNDNLQGIACVPANFAQN